MSKFRRYFIPGATYFFTLITYRRHPLFADTRALPYFGQVLRECRSRWPFETIAMVVLPDHLHAMWSLPREDDRYSARWSWIKKEFTKRWLANGGQELAVTLNEKYEHRRGIWQPRFWEHTIDDESDFDNHFHYIHFNPVKHQHVACPRAWKASTFHRWMKAGVYNFDWSCGSYLKPPINFAALKDTFGEP
jgi:putative transposase